ncbi:ACP phosphodiesterase [Kaistella sp. PBT33-4]|uniref:acyl carrier protein phosphodiesterase n=1 Tax=Kaistella sp. PBT33-4 TaxID=3032000 RepID=UPI0023D89F82|nr:ACP phosphodiesterase [Kaistella sp. PBT33-4]MDF0718548.1 ACP phosphodiesterase [Kaistella sp. PBT33-4]
MNFLAHSYLAFSDGHIVGQFLQDFIRNKDRFSFPPEIVEGILLHREIDTFTDAHPEIHEAKKVFSPLVRLYSGAFVDVAFDYFLANNLPEETLKLHAERVYGVLRHHLHLFPPPFHRMLEGMERDNWLYHYREEQGIHFSFRNVLNKARYLDKNLAVFEVFLNSRPQLEAHFMIFFPDLVRHAETFNSRFRI